RRGRSPPRRSAVPRPPPAPLARAWCWPGDRCSSSRPPAAPRSRSRRVHVRAVVALSDSQLGLLLLPPWGIPGSLPRILAGKPAICTPRVTWGDPPEGTAAGDRALSDVGPRRALAVRVVWPGRGVRPGRGRD